MKEPGPIAMPAKLIAEARARKPLRKEDMRWIKLNEGRCDPITKEPYQEAQKSRKSKTGKSEEAIRKQNIPTVPKQKLKIVLPKPGGAPITPPVPKPPNANQSPATHRSSTSTLENKQYDVDILTTPGLTQSTTRVHTTQTSNANQDQQPITAMQCGNKDRSTCRTRVPGFAGEKPWSVSTLKNNVGKAKMLAIVENKGVDPTPFQDQKAEAIAEEIRRLQHIAYVAVQAQTIKSRTTPARLENSHQEHDVVATTSPRKRTRDDADGDDEELPMSKKLKPTDSCSSAGGSQQKMHAETPNAPSTPSSTAPKVVVRLTAQQENTLFNVQCRLDRISELFAKTMDDEHNGNFPEDISDVDYADYPQFPEHDLVAEQHLIRNKNGVVLLTREVQYRIRDILEDSCALWHLKRDGKLPEFPGIHIDPEWYFGMSTHDEAVAKLSLDLSLLVDELVYFMQFVDPEIPNLRSHARGMAIETFQGITWERGVTEWDEEEVGESSRGDFVMDDMEN